MTLLSHTVELTLNDIYLEQLPAVYALFSLSGLEFHVYFTGNMSNEVPGHYSSNFYGPNNTWSTFFTNCSQTMNLEITWCKGISQWESWDCSNYRYSKQGLALNLSGQKIFDHENRVARQTWYLSMQKKVWCFYIFLHLREIINKGGKQKWQIPN